MPSFTHCLYHAYLFSTKEQYRYDLDYVRCEGKRLVGSDGKMIYEGIFDTSPFDSGDLPPDLPQMSWFLRPLKKPKKSLIKDGHWKLRDSIDREGGKLETLGTEWEIKGGVKFPPIARVKKSLKSRCTLLPCPVDPKEWKKMVKARISLSPPDDRTKFCPINLTQNENGIYAQGVYGKYGSGTCFYLSKGSFPYREKEKTMSLNLGLWPPSCFVPETIAIGDNCLFLKWENEEVVILGIKNE